MSTTKYNKWDDIDIDIKTLRGIYAYGFEKPSTIQKKSILTFLDKKDFNDNINNWNVSNVTNMEGMFYRAKLFNQSLNDWNVSNVENMWRMFTDSGMSELPEWYSHNNGAN